MSLRVVKTSKVKVPGLYGRDGQDISSSERKEEVSADSRSSETSGAFLYDVLFLRPLLWSHRPRPSTGPEIVEGRR